MSEPNSTSGRLDELAEEFAQRHQRGERPSIDEYARRYPELADEIRDLFPALLMMQEVRPVPGNATGPFEPPAHGERRLPDRLGEYRILREVGRGGMGIVYEAEQESLGCRHALKVLPGHALMDPQRLRRFQREARAAARLHHTNIVPVYGVGSHEGVYYYVMQFIQGLGLDEVLVELKRLRKSRGFVGVRTSANPPGEVTAADVAQGLLTGDYQASGGRQPPDEATNHARRFLILPSISPAKHRIRRFPNRASNTGRASPASACRWPRRWPTRTAKARCTATSSHRTCFWIRRARFGSRISAWPRGLKATT